MQTAGLILLAIVATEVNGFVPSLFQRNVLDIQFGECPVAKVRDIFSNYPDACYSVINDISSLIQRGITNQTQYQPLYRQLCSEDCTAQIKTFNQDCNVPQLVDPILQACEQNDLLGYFCLSGLFINNGTKAAINCYSAMATGHCSENCQSSLIQLRTDLDCCVNTLFNTSTYGLDKLRVASQELWALCGINVVDRCTNIAALSNAPAIWMSTTVTFLLLSFSAITWLFL